MHVQTPSCLLQKALGQNPNTNYGLSRPALSGRVKARGGSVFALVGVRKKLVLKQGGEPRGGTFIGGVGLVDGSDGRVIIKPLGNDVARRQRLEVDEVVGGHHTQGLLDTEPKGALQALDDATTQGPQAARQRATRPTLGSLDLPARGEGSTHQILELLLSLGVGDLEGLRLRGRVRQSLPQP